MISKKVKVIFDTNVWISFLIGKRLFGLQKLILDERIKVIATQQLLLEIRLVTQKEKLKKYFPLDRVNEQISILEVIAEEIEISPKNKQSRDPKDNFYLI